MADNFTAEPIRFPVLIGDIGGTNARFAVLAEPDAPTQSFAPVATADYPDIQAAIAASVFDHTSLRPHSAIIALAGPVKGDTVELTNAHWVIRPTDLMAKAGLSDVILLNDFEALALALTALDGADLELIGGDPGSAVGAKVVLGPGTGLGVGALVPAGPLLAPVPGEGGHVALGPVEPDEFPLWPHIEPEDGRISAEALLSGRGLVRLYRAVVSEGGLHPQFHDPAEISHAGLDGSDPAAERTLSLYARLLGRLAGDMALVFLARGGTFIGGGIPPRILPFIRGGEFRRAFEAKAPHEALMASMPTWVITRDNPALPGLAAFASAPGRFGVALAGRRWRL